MTKEQQSCYTDRNVAEMLGLYKEGWYLLPESCKCSPPVFGLSTPPGPEADANAARYVLPFIDSHSWYLVYEFDHGTHIVTIEDGSDAIKLAYKTADTFAEAICRACLDAVRATSSA